MINKTLSIAMALLILIAPLSNGYAASFDCALAKHPVEKLICSEDKISKLDENLADLYKLKMHLLFGKNKKQLKNSQRKWVEYIREKVNRRMILNFPVKPYKLSEWYTNRIKQLEFIGQTINGYKFSRIDNFNIKNEKNAKPSKQNINYVTTEISYPVITSPNTQGTIELNKLLKHIAINNSTPWSENPDTDVITYFMQPTFIGNIINVEYGVYRYGHWAPRGYTEYQNLHYDIKKAKKLMVKDFINFDSDWYQTLLKESQIVLCSLLHKYDCEQLKEHGPSSSIVDAIKRHGGWGLKSEGLEIDLGTTYRLYTSLNVRKIIIPWKKIMPILLPEFKNQISEN